LQIENAISFTNKSKALKFEKYLKSHSGLAFVMQVFLIGYNIVKSFIKNKMDQCFCGLK
jgi:hypothetical protein